MKSKKGMLLAEETLKTVLAVISIGFLIYFLVSLYFSNQNNQEQKQAQATLDKLNDFLQSSQMQGTINAITPGGWYIFSFTKEIKPDNCLGTNCICICSKVLKYNYNSFWRSEDERQAEECLDNGKCLNIPNLKFFDKIEIKNSREGLTNIRITKTDDNVLVEELK